jgi:ankyrin repeat protein
MVDRLVGEPSHERVSSVPDGSVPDNSVPDNSVPDNSDPVALAHWLFDRARGGEADRLAAYVDAGVPVELTDAAGNTLLMLAAYHGHAAVVSALIERGAEVNSLNDRGQSPLAGAVFKGYPDVVEVLAAAGADPNRGSPTARQAAVFFERPDLLAILDQPPS